MYIIACKSQCKPAEEYAISVCKESSVSLGVPRLPNVKTCSLFIFMILYFRHSTVYYTQFKKHQSVLVELVIAIF